MLASTSIRTSLLPLLPLLIFGAAALLCPCHAEAARWYEDYEQAVQLIDSEGCSPQAIELLGAAVVDKDEPRLAARTYAQRRIDYLPYYQLARAHLACGNTQLARKYLDDARSEGVAAAPKLDELERLIAELEREQQEPEGPTVDAAQLATRTRQVGQRLDAAEAMLAQLEQRLARPDPTEALRRAPEIASTIRTSLDNASQSLHSARARLVTGRETSDPFAIADASTLAADLSRSLQDIDHDIDQAVVALDEQRQAELRTPTAEPLPSAPVPSAGSAGSEVGAAVRATSPTSTTSPPPTPGSQPALTDPLETLRTAARLYVETDYEAVLGQLDPAALDAAGITTSRQRAAAALLRAAAHFALLRTQGWNGDASGTPAGASQADGSRQQTLATEQKALIADLAECHRLAPDIRPDPQVFPPPFLAVFEAARP